jgi:TPR repeat protein
MNNDVRAEQLCDQGKEFIMANSVAEGVKCFVEAIKLGSSRGMVDLGYCYENGYGIECDLSNSFEWYNKAAELNNPLGQRNLGSCYEHGRGVAKDLQKAVYWYTKAAEQGHGEAQNNLADCYDKGVGVEKNPAIAMYWYTKSAESGFPWGICNLASCYAEGYGVEANPKRVFELYMKAASEPINYPLGQYSVGACYCHGIGVTKDPIEGIDWFRKAAEQGDENAIYNLEAMNVKRCPSCMKWNTIFSQEIHNGKEDMLVCINEKCPDVYNVFNATTRRLISGKMCPKCGSNRQPLNSGAWVCYNTKCSEYQKIDRRF